MPGKVIHAFRKTADTIAESAKTLPQRYFVAPEVFEEEQEKIFARQWVLVGHQSEVAKPGDFFVAEVAGEPRPTTFGQARRLRRGGELEAGVRELFGVLSLPGSTSDVVEGVALRFGRERSRRRTVSRRVHADQ